LKLRRRVTAVKKEPNARCLNELFKGIVGLAVLNMR
jgi:hypothetical protein